MLNLDEHMARVEATDDPRLRAALLAVTDRMVKNNKQYRKFWGDMTKLKSLEVMTPLLEAVTVSWPGE